MTDGERVRGTSVRQRGPDVLSSTGVGVAVRARPGSFVGSGALGGCLTDETVGNHRIGDDIGWESTPARSPVFRRATERASFGARLSAHRFWARQRER